MYAIGYYKPIQLPVIDNVFLKKPLLKATSFVLLIFVYSVSSQALPKHDPVPGGIALLPVPEGHKQLKVFYKKKRVAIIHDKDKYYAMIGIPLKTRASKQQVNLIWNSGKKQTLSFSVKAKAYQEQHLTIKNKRKVNPYEKDMDRIIKEKSKKNKAKIHWSNQMVNHDFIIPVKGRISSIFGLKRFFNKQARRPHSGLDIATTEGTPIKAIESGTVIESGNFFFSGNMIYLDHGQGIISLYAHMNSIKVKTGDKIKKGQVIGTVGETGRVTGPHLHLAIIANQTLIDPVLLLPDLNITKNAHY